MPRHEVFIETGTEWGNTLEQAAMSGLFDHHVSIDLCPYHHKVAKLRFKGKPNVKLHLGSSPEILKKVIKPDKKTFFWLDAHYQGTDKPAQSDAGRGECPLLEELEVIKSFTWKEKPTIYIDDSQMFTDDFWQTPEAKKFDRAEWPTLDQIKAALGDWTVQTMTLTVWKHFLQCD